MAPKTDPRREVGNIVKTFAKNVSTDRQCSNRFGVDWAKKEVYGWVRDVEKVVGINKKGLPMSTTYITATFIIVPGVVRTKTMHIVNIKTVPDDEKQQFLAWAQVSSAEEAIASAKPESVDNVILVTNETNTTTPPATLPTPPPAMLPTTLPTPLPVATLPTTRPTPLAATLPTTHRPAATLPTPLPAATLPTPLPATLPMNIQPNNNFFMPTIDSRNEITRQLDFDMDAFDFEQQSPPPPQNNNQTNLGTPTSVDHDVSWYSYNDLPTNINGKVPVKDWSVITATGVEWTKDCNRSRHISRLEVFLQMFPPYQLSLMVRLTNEQLKRNNREPTTGGEIIKFFGMLVLITKFEFSRRASLWSKTSIHEFEPPPNLGKTGMSRDRFDHLMQSIRFSQQPNDRPSDLTHERWSWMLVDDFVNNFNTWRQSNFIPGELLCIDESMSRWYGLGGDWINIGLPNYVSIDRKPDNGCEIQNLCCAKSGVMLRLRLVKSAEEEKAAAQELMSDENTTQQQDNSMLHGTKICLELVSNYFWSKRVVCGDSYFASVGCAEELLKYDLRFIGVVKTATKKFPMNYLNRVQFHGARGERKGLVRYQKDSNKPEMVAFAWLDRERRYFISTAYGLDAGKPYYRDRYRQLEEGCKFTPAQKVQLYVPQPKACEVYYDTCAAIDHHNRDRVDTLKIDKKIKTKDWAKRVNFTILSMILVDCWQVWSKITRNKKGEEIESQKEFYSHLATELIKNRYDERIGSNKRSASGTLMSDELVDPVTQRPRAGTGIHLSPTKRLRKDKDGQDTTFRAQGRCMVCKVHLSTWQCSQCLDDIKADPSVKRSGWVCGTTKNQQCFKEHCKQVHDCELD